METDKLIKLASHLKNRMVWERRAGGKEFILFKDSKFSPLSDLQFNLSHSVHGQTLPNDLIYKEIYHSLERLSDRWIEGFEGEIEPDIYTKDLMEWASEFSDFIDDAIDEGYIQLSDHSKFLDIVQAGNVYWKNSIHDSVKNFLENYF